MKDWTDFGIDTHGKVSGEVKTICPKCSPYRKKSKYPCLNCNLDKGVWHCWHCDWSGSLKTGEEQRSNPSAAPLIFRKPVYRASPLPASIVAWFAERGIPEKVLVRRRISCGPVYMPQVEQEVPAIQFPYFRNGEVINCKYRSRDKHFRMASGAERLLYGLDDIHGDTLIICEGELDAMALEVAGFSSVVSVPDGAPALTAKNYETKFDFLLSAEEYLKPLKRIILAVDGDAPVYSLFDEGIPSQPKSLQELQQDIEKKLMPYITHVNHAGYMGLITPSPNPAGILADLLASAINQNIGAYTIGPSAVAMERRVIRWLNDLIGYDEKAGGNLTSGGMMANFTGIKLARDFTTGDKAQHEGLNGKWAVYVSEQRHVSIDKSVDAAGIGRNYLRPIATDDNYRIKIDELEEAIKRDKAQGIKPMGIIGLAGTTNLGAVDDLEALAEIAKREVCWYHVDAAYGGGMLLSHKYPNVLKGLALADSVTIDPHKWFYAPLDAGAVLVKDHDQLTRSFGIQHAYLTEQGGQKSERYQFYVHGFEQSKRFRSLKVWMSFHHYGKDKIGEWVDNNVAQAKHLHHLAESEGMFESATEPVMSAVCLHYKNNNLNKAGSKALHVEVASRIEKGGQFWFATTEMKGKTWFRINPVNIHTTIKHMEQLYEVLRKTCEEVEKETQEIKKNPA